MLHAHTNAGSVGKNKSASSQTDSSIVVRGNLVKRCYQVEEIFERPLDSFGIVETMDYGFIFAPFFKMPVATNETQILVNSENEHMHFQPMHGLIRVRLADQMAI